MSRRREIDQSTKAIGVCRTARAWNIGLRTAHIAVSGVLVGGHVFDVPRDATAPLALRHAHDRRATRPHGGFSPLCGGVIKDAVCCGVKLILLSLIPWLWDVPSTDSVGGRCDCLRGVAHAGPVSVLLGDSPPGAGLIHVHRAAESPLSSQARRTVLEP